jgi:hypothetical protein
MEARSKLITALKNQRGTVATAAPVLIDAIDMAIKRIEAEADAAADRITETLSARKSAEYERAAERAASLLALADPGSEGPGNWPALEADVVAGTIDPRTGNPVATIVQAAEVINLTRDPWLAALDAIRMTRLSAKNAVRTAQSVEEIDGILSTLIWPA